MGGGGVMMKGMGGDDSMGMGIGMGMGESTTMGTSTASSVTFAGEDARENLTRPAEARWKHGKKARLLHTPGKPYYFQHRITDKATARAVKKVLEDAGPRVDWPMGPRWKGRAIGVVI